MAPLATKIKQKSRKLRLNMKNARKFTLRAFCCVSIIKNKAYS